MNFEEQLAKSEGATKVIGEYLFNRSLTDMSISDNLKKENKNLKECFKYICQEAEKKKTGNCAVIEDSEVFGMAIHYYDEDEIEVKQSGEYTLDQKRVPTSKESNEEGNEEVSVIKRIKPKVKKRVVSKDKDIEGQLSLF